MLKVTIKTRLLPKYRFVYTPDILGYFAMWKESLVSICRLCEKQRNTRTGLVKLVDATSGVKLKTSICISKLIPVRTPGSRMPLGLRRYKEAVTDSDESDSSYASDGSSL